MNDTARFRLALVILLAATIALFLASLAVGPADAGVLPSLAALITGDDGALSLVMREIRMPRAILGLMIGITLGLSGAVLQGYLRNPLAEPGLLGISASASFGAVIAIYTGFSLVFPLAVPLDYRDGHHCTACFPGFSPV